MWIKYHWLTYIETSNYINEVNSYCMRVENSYPVYKTIQDRENSVQKVYEELQLVFFHKSQSEKNGSLLVKEQMVHKKKGK
jgi:hypothetical protein